MYDVVTYEFSPKIYFPKVQIPPCQESPDRPPMIWPIGLVCIAQWRYEPSRHLVSHQVYNWFSSHPTVSYLTTTSSGEMVYCKRWIQTHQHLQELPIHKPTVWIMYTSILIWSKNDRIPINPKKILCEESRLTIKRITHDPCFIDIKLLSDQYGLAKVIFYHIKNKALTIVQSVLSQWKTATIFTLVPI